MVALQTGGIERLGEWSQLPIRIMKGMRGGSDYAVIGEGYALLLFPAGFLVVTLFCFNFIGDGLRDALDPKDR